MIYRIKLVLHKTLKSNGVKYGDRADRGIIVNLRSFQTGTLKFK